MAATSDDSYVDNFDDMNLCEPLMRGIYSYGFEKPSVIQGQAIPIMITGKDMIAQAQSGTGKTGTFAISTLQLIDTKKGGCQAVIISPTRELAEQTANVFTTLSSFMDVYIVTCVGKMHDRDAGNKLNSSTASIAVGTPGKLIDMFTPKKGVCVLPIQNVKLLVIDEADEMFTTSFQEQMRAIISSISKETQICLFSATLPPEVIDITANFMRDPAHILVKTEMLTLDGIKQYKINVGNSVFKYETLLDLYKTISVSQTIIYVNSVRLATELAKNLINDNYTVSVIHGQLEAYDRREIVKQFRQGTTRILISTDLLSRGIDIQQISIVINYELPRNDEAYLHRIGRSGRFGRKGTAINLVSDKELHRIDEIERFYSTQIQDLPDTFVLNS